MPAKKIEDYPALYYYDVDKEHEVVEIPQFRLVGQLMSPSHLVKGHACTIYDINARKLGDYPPELWTVALEHYEQLFFISSGAGQFYCQKVLTEVVLPVCPHCKKVL